MPPHSTAHDTSIRNVTKSFFALINRYTNPASVRCMPTCRLSLSHALRSSCVLRKRLVFARQLVAWGLYAYNFYLYRHVTSLRHRLVATIALAPTKNAAHQARRGLDGRLTNGCTPGAATAAAATAGRASDTYRASASSDRNSSRQPCDMSDSVECHRTPPRTTPRFVT